MSKLEKIRQLVTRMSAKKCRCGRPVGECATPTSTEDAAEDMAELRDSANALLDVAQSAADFLAAYDAEYDGDRYYKARAGAADALRTALALLESAP